MEATPERCRRVCQLARQQRPTYTNAPPPAPPPCLTSTSKAPMHKASGPESAQTHTHTRRRHTPPRPARLAGRAEQAISTRAHSLHAAHMRAHPLSHTRSLSVVTTNVAAVQAARADGTPSSARQYATPTMLHIHDR
jgi:hypothetical protein